MEYGWFLTHCKANVRALLAIAFQRYAAKEIIPRVFVISTQGNSGFWENKEFA
jgi:hypothetical protein